MLPNAALKPSRSFTEAAAAFASSPNLTNLALKSAISSQTLGVGLKSSASGELASDLELSGKSAGIFAAASSIADIIKCYDELIGLDAKTVGGHSLRAGFLTSGAARGASIFKMMDVSRHRSVDTLRDYVRDAENEVVTPK